MIPIVTAAATISAVAAMNAQRGATAAVCANHQGFTQESLDETARIYQLKVRFTTCENGELVSVEHEPCEVEISTGLFGKKKNVWSTRPVYQPVMQTVKAKLPKDARVLSDAIDWYNGYIRIFYSLPTTPAPNP